jgi:hypothetical protein
MPTSTSRLTLRFGPYTTPQFRYGDVVMDEVRGEVTIVGLTDAPIPWPIGKRGRVKTFVVYAGLVDAVRKEANITVCHWWGITPQTVSKWRKALETDRVTEGTNALLRDHFTPQRQKVMRVKRAPKYRDPVRNAKIRSSRLGKPRPKHVIDALRKSHVGTNWSEQTRQRQLESRMRRFPESFAPWTPEEDELVRTLSIRVAAKRTGRSRNKVAERRAALGIGRKDGGP